MASTFLMVALLALALGSAQGTTIWRHTYTYILKDNSAAGKNATLTLLQKIISTLPADSMPMQYSFGADLNISSTLYTKVPGAVNQTQVDIGGVSDFATVDGLFNYWDALLNSSDFKALSAMIASSSRTQTLVQSCGKSNATYWRHQFAYTFANDSSINLSNSMAAWAWAIQMAPAPPAFYSYGADLGFGMELYNSTNKYTFTATLDFVSQANLTAFWNWWFPMETYQDLVLSTAGAVRLQYAAKGSE